MQKFSVEFFFLSNHDLHVTIIVLVRSQNLWHKVLHILYTSCCPFRFKNIRFNIFFVVYCVFERVDRKKS